MYISTTTINEEHVTDEKYPWILPVCPFTCGSEGPCNGYKEGKCIILINTEFKNRDYNEPCPFFGLPRTEEEERAIAEYCE